MEGSYRVSARVNQERRNGGSNRPTWAIARDRSNAGRPLISAQVIILPHSHADPGWLKTFEEYYAQQTRSILDNVAAKLTEHKNMTFIWTEIAFFALWWDRYDNRLAPF